MSMLMPTASLVRTRPTVQPRPWLRRNCTILAHGAAVRAEPAARLDAFAPKEDFVREVDIGAAAADSVFAYSVTGPGGGASPPPLELSHSAFVVGSTAVAFDQGLDEQLKEQVVNALLFAQLAASQKHNKNEKPGEWYKLYWQVLEGLGFLGAGAGAPEFAKHKGSGKEELHIHKAVAQTFIGCPAAGAAELGPVLMMLGGLASLPENEDALALFNIASATARGAGNFQVASCTAAGGGRYAVLLLGAFHFAAPGQEGVADLLLAYPGNAIRFHWAVQRLVLGRAAYERVGEEVARKLGSRAADFVEGIELY